ncbi:uroporphyrinogen-III C-methyltransferase [Xylophilus sp. GOD-11R]|uniref:uroporphyrinogen-III C-methyltransferase n=1 Tax=Xylophilus sp. GOD-11R TaxID=3089814 RepID=UPI00298C00B4|nr:uroporphyrinogen-III C-methyltransferase [Xylophilus sp. GOD-11R]WPB59058.1 uroporphyrinogen-III C-methyltransferase [Xylophilus sp. GOD-11R]
MNKDFPSSSISPSTPPTLDPVFQLRGGEVHDLPIETAVTGRGRCILVGAGPGDPDLLTVKAVKAIASATLLLVDDLVSDAIVALAQPSARVVYVGKRGGCKSTPQAFIQKLMLMAVREGETVVRLKGGDPFVFGRGGEEVEHMRAFGIEPEVINGITAGLAAVTTLGVPLTHREHAQGVIFVTGHAKPGSAGTDWATLATTAHAARLTLVVYMGVTGAAHIQQGLLQGLPGATPVAVVQNVSLPSQRHTVCTLEKLHDTIVAEGFASPSVIVVGDVLCGLAAAGAQDSVQVRAA